MRSMQYQLGVLGTISAFAYRHRETKKNQKPRRTDGQTDMSKLTVAYRNFAKAPKTNDYLLNTTCTFYTHQQQLHVSACKPSNHQAVRDFIRKNIV